MSELLAPRLLSRLERVQLGTRRRLAGSLSAEHRSTRFGSSLDFSDYRPYHPGDDFRRIDYNLYARLDLVLLRLYEAEDDLAVRLLVDTSRSMAGPKLAQATRVAAALGFVALVRRDVVSVHAFPSGAHPPRLRGRGAATQLFAHLGALEADGETRFAAAALDLLARPGPRGLTVVLSDLLTSEWQAGLERLPARRGDLAVVHVLDPAELEPDLRGDLDLVDDETGATVSVSLDAAALAIYRRGAAAWQAEVAARTRRAGGAYLPVRVGDDLEELLLGSARRQGILR